MLLHRVWLPSPMDPMCLGSSKLCCCKSNFDSGHEMTGPKGCLNAINKCCCIVSGCQMPFVCSCCGANIVGDVAAGHAPNEADDEWMTSVFWLYYCCCEGCGITGTIDPWIHNDQKLCCLEAQSRMAMGEVGGDGGCCHSRAKTCCCVNAFEGPPTMDIGMACCGVKCVGGEPNTHGDG